MTHNETFYGSATPALVDIDELAGLIRRKATEAAMLAGVAQPDPTRSAVLTQLAEPTRPVGPPDSANVTRPAADDPSTGLSVGSSRWRRNGRMRGECVAGARRGSAVTPTS